MKKKLFLVLAGLGLAVSMSAQTLYIPGWPTSGTGNSTITGNVGIGTSAPNSKLQVIGAIESATQSGSDRKALQMFINSNYGGIDVFDHDEGDPLSLILNESGGNVGIGTVTPAGKLSIRNGTYGGLLVTANNGAGWATSYGKIQAGSYSWGDGSPTATNLALNPDGGNVGIGLINPFTTLMLAKIVNGVNTARIGFYGQTGDGNNADNGGIRFINDNSPYYSEVAGFRGVDSELAGLHFYTANRATPAIQMTILPGGNVIIGKTSQTNSAYKLDVAGSIRADEIVVNTDGADFVFDSGYKLLSLSEVEKFIQENKHLPDIQSASDMIENGMNMSEMQTKLLQKLEEMTLYMIEQNKRIEALENENQELENK